MKLPDAVKLSPTLAVEMARRNGLRVEVARPMPFQGIVNTVIALDDQFVLKVPRSKAFFQLCKRLVLLPLRGFTRLAHWRDRPRRRC